MERDKKVFYEVRAYIDSKHGGISGRYATYPDLQLAQDEALELSNDHTGILFVKRVESAIVFLCEQGKVRS